MQAITTDRYGGPDVLRLAEVPTPTPGPGDVLVRIAAASVNAADWHLLRADPFLVRLMFGLRRPKHRILGCDVAGTVVAAGSGAGELRPGDEVFGDLSPHAFGAFAEFVAAPARAFAQKPANVPFAHAAALPVAGQTALQALRDAGQLQAGEALLVHGASGGVGSFAVQLGKVLGARVTAVCSTAHVDFVRGLGADAVVDRTRDDVTRGTERFDLVVDCGAFGPPRRFARILRDGGRYVLIGGATRRLFTTMALGPLWSRLGRHRWTAMVCKPNVADLRHLAELTLEGRITPAIDRTFALADVPDAIRHLESGRARGKTVIPVATNAAAPNTAAPNTAAPNRSAT